MRLLVLAAVGLVLAATSGAEAQGLRDPRELPPAGFTGQQYTDSAGCVFLRAGISGRTTWVPRIGANRRQLCGYPPSFRPPPPVAVAEVPTPEPAAPPVASAAPVPAAPAPRRARVPAATAPVAIAAAAAAADPRTPGCPDAAPYGKRVTLADGRSALACVRSPDRLEAHAARVASLAVPPVARTAEAPVELAQADPTAEATPIGAAGIGPRVACPPEAPVLARVETRDGGSVLICAPAGTPSAGRSGAATVPVAQTTTIAASGIHVPKGYRLAWKDDRLNPLRGQGTLVGQAAQDRVWTRKVPAELVAPAVKPRVILSASGAAPQRKTQVSLSASAAAPAPHAATTGRLYVQVGSFGVPANADGARGRLAALGLPVAGGKGAIGGKPVQVVFAGPFGSAAAAQAALVAARRAGFADAFIR